MTPKQIQTLQTARRRLDLSEPQYRMILRNTGGVGSSTQLTNRGFEQVMAVMEEMGFSNPARPTYWRDRSRGGGTRDSLTSAERMRHKILDLAGRCARYPLGAMVRNQSDGRTDLLDELTNHELYNLIEAYKAIETRQQRRARQGELFPTPATNPAPPATRNTPPPAAEGSAPGAVTEGPARTPATATDGHSRTRRNAPAKPAARISKTPASIAPSDVDDDIPF